MDKNMMLTVSISWGESILALSLLQAQMSLQGMHSLAQLAQVAILELNNSGPMGEAMQKAQQLPWEPCEQNQVEIIKLLWA